MALSLKFANEHIAAWEGKLSTGYANYRAQWPSRLFHHAPLENIACILKSGELQSRNHSDGHRPIDVADATVVGARSRAHKFCRFYFRPRTPTQFHIEGIRKKPEYYNGVTHSPTLAMLIFDARKILTTPGVRFSDGNMQSGGTLDDDTDQFFKEIPFTKVYHEGGINGDYSIINARCAEVLCPSPLDIDDLLQAVICRSHAERLYLLDLLGDSASSWVKKIRVSDDLRVFEKKYTFVESVSLGLDGISFSMSPRPDYADVDVRVEVLNSKEKAVINFGPGPLKPFPPSANKWWVIKKSIAPDTYKISVWLEGCLAFRASITQDDSPF